MTKIDFKGVYSNQEVIMEEEKKNKPILKLLGEDGNAFAILGKARKVARKNEMDWDKISKEAKSGDYNNLLMVMDNYFEVE